MKAIPLLAMIAVLLVSVLVTPATADDHMPAILKKVASKHKVLKMEEKAMQEVRGDLIILPELNLLGSKLQLVLLQPDSVLWGISSGNNPFYLNQLNLLNGPNLSTGSLNVADLFYIGGANAGWPPSTLEFGVLHYGQLLYRRNHTPW